MYFFVSALSRFKTDIQRSNEEMHVYSSVDLNIIIVVYLCLIRLCVFKLNYRYFFYLFLE